MTKLSDLQRACILAMDEMPQGVSSAYNLKIAIGRRVSVSTLRSLSSLKIVRPLRQAGDFAFPQIARYALTHKGRDIASTLRGEAQ